MNIPDVKPSLILSEVGGQRFVVLASLAASIAVIFVIASLWSQFYFLYSISLWLFLFAAFFGVVGAVISTAARLDLLTEGAKRDRIDKELHRLDEALQSIDSRLQKVTATTTSKKDLLELSEEVFKERIYERVASLSVAHVAKLAKDEIVARYKQNVFHERGFEAIREKIDIYIRDLHEELKSQRRAANQNLLWGVIFSIAGLGVMAFFLLAPLFTLAGAITFAPRVETVTAPVGDIESWSLFFQTFIPKFTFVILFESIAFFFFRAYSDDRSMIKYLRNEATNVESRSLALLSAIYFSNEAQQDGIFRQLMSTERNFTLKRGEKLTVEALAKDSTFLFEEIARRLTPKFDQAKFAEGASGKKEA